MLWDGDIEAFKQEIAIQGHEYHELHYKPFGQTEYPDFGEDMPVAFFGSINAAIEIQRNKPWVPGPWCNLNNLRCSNYFAYWGKYLWNDIYTMMPYGEVPRFISHMANMDGEDHSFFLRPDSGTKVFPGQILSHITKYKCTTPIEVSPTELCVLAPENAPLWEARCFMIEDQLVASSLYKGNNKIKIHPLETEELRRVKATIDKIFQEVDNYPDPFYVMDLGFSDRVETGKVLELNSASCSGQYACDISKIIEAAANVATADWEDIYEWDANAGN